MDEIVLNSKGFCFPLRLGWEINGFVIWSNWGEERHYLPTCGQELCGRTQSRSSREDGWCPREGQLCWAVLCQVISVVSNSATLWTGPPDSSVHASLQARILDYVAMPSSRGSSQSRDETQVSRLTGRFFTANTTGEAPRELTGEAHLRGAKDSLDSHQEVISQERNQGTPRVHSLSSRSALSATNWLSSTRSPG